MNSNFTPTPRRTFFHFPPFRISSSSEVGSNIDSNILFLAEVLLLLLILFLVKSLSVYWVPGLMKSE